MENYPLAAGLMGKDPQWRSDCSLVGGESHEGAEPDILRKAPIEDRRAERAALADETNVAGPRHRAGEGRIESGERAHHTQAMGSDDPKRAAPRLLEGLSLEGFAFGAPLNPAEMIIAPFTRTAAIFGQDLIPSTFDRFVLTGETVTPKGLPIRFRRTERLTEPAVSVAPITATVSAAKKTSSGWRKRKMSWAGSAPEM